MKTHTWILAGLCALTAVGCVDREAQKQAGQTQTIVTNPVKSVSVQAATTQNVTESIEITGNIATSNDSEVSAKQSGRLIRVNVRDGDPVFAGQVIAQQDSTQLQATYRQSMAMVASARSQLQQAIQTATLTPTKSRAAVRQAEGQVSTARQQLRSAQANLAKVKSGGRSEERLTAAAQLRSAKSNMDKAAKDLDRMKSLVAQGAAAQTELDVAQWNYDSALATWQAAQQNLAMVEAPRPEDVAIAQAAVEQAREGIRNAEEGLSAARANQRLDVLLNDAVRTAQAQVASAQAQADADRAAMSDTQIRAPFSGKIAGRPMQVGSLASPGSPVARIVGTDGAYFEGQISEDQVRLVAIGRPVKVRLSALPGETFVGTVLAVSNLGSSVGRLFSVRIGIGGNLADIKPGMFANGTIEVRTVASATVVPATAVLHKNNQDVVMLAIGDKAKSVAVTKGIAQGTVVQVIGIKPGDPVIVQGQADLDDGVKIKVDKPVTATSKPSGS